MERIALVWLAAFLVPASAVAQQVDGSAPDHVIKFLDVKFADPANWSCRKSSETAEDSCLWCTMTGMGSGDIAVTKAADGESETISDSSAAEICADVLTT